MPACPPTPCSAQHNTPRALRSGTIFQRSSRQWLRPLRHIRPSSRLYSSPFPTRRNTSAPEAAALHAVRAGSNAMRPVPSVSAARKEAGIVSIRLPGRPLGRRPLALRRSRADLARRRKGANRQARSKPRMSILPSPPSTRNPRVPGRPRGRRPQTRPGAIYTERRAGNPCGSAVRNRLRSLVRLRWTRVVRHRPRDRALTR